MMLKRKIIAPCEFEEMLKTIPQTKTIPKDDVEAIFRIGYKCGVRRDDILSLEKINFNLEKKLLLVRSAKTSASYITTIMPSDVKWFREWLKIEPLAKKGGHYVRGTK